MQRHFKPASKPGLAGVSPGDDVFLIAQESDTPVFPPSSADLEDLRIAKTAWVTTYAEADDEDSMASARELSHKYESLEAARSLVQVGGRPHGDGPAHLGVVAGAPLEGERVQVLVQGCAFGGPGADVERPDRACLLAAEAHPRDHRLLSLGEDREGAALYAGEQGAVWRMSLQG